MPVFQIATINATAQAAATNSEVIVGMVANNGQISSGWWVGDEQAISPALPIPKSNQGSAPMLSTVLGQFQIYWTRGATRSDYVILAQNLTTSTPYPNNQTNLWSGTDTAATFTLVIDASGNPTLTKN